MTNSLFSLKNKTIAITGGHGQLGKQFAMACITHGANVAILDYVEPPRASCFKDVDPNRLLTLKVDIRNIDQLKSALGNLVDRFGSIDGLINNAALDSPPDAPPEENGPFESYPEDSWDKVLDINLKGTFLCCQVFGGHMAANGGGSIINVGSIYGVVSPDQSLYEYRRKSGHEFYKPVAYAASKSGVYNLTRYLASYWGRKNVRVNTVTFAGVYNNQDEDFLKTYCQRIPMGRMAKEDEYNGSIVYLLSEASSYMTGSSLVIDGGWTAI